MRLINISLTICCIIFSLHSFSQLKSGFRKVDDFKINDAKVKVYFMDPIVELSTAFPEFETKPDPEKNKLLEVYLANHDLYLFSFTSKDGKIISYVVRGNPEQKESSYRYKLDIIDGDMLTQSRDNPLAVRKTVNNLTISGEFFEHMAPFQQPRFKKVTTANIWGNIIHINPYAPIKDTIEKLIQLDQTTGIPEIKAP
jgi:hypothetical protein